MLDVLDGHGQVTGRHRCIVEHGREYRQPWWSVRFLDEPDLRRFGQNFPERAADCSLQGPSLRYGRWRFTFLDESAARPRAPKPEQRASLPAGTWRAVEAELEARTSFPVAPRLRGFRSAGTPLCGWTTSADSFGYFWSFVCHPAAGRNGSGAVVHVKDHRLRREAKSRARGLYQAALSAATLD